MRSFYVNNSQGNIVRSIDILNKKEYNYEYDEGKIVRATESDIIITNDIVTTKTLVNTIKYYYDTEGKMTKKVIMPTNGEKHTVYYENNDDNTVVKFKVGDRTVTSHSKSDSFGRKEFDELQLGTGFVSRQFSYCSGEVTDKHIEKAKLKSTATTQLVSQIVFSNGTKLSYEYDAEERITSVVETYTDDGNLITNTTLYTYDALGQLLTETYNGNVVNSMEYDNYGNIKSKKGVAYTYGDGIWKDLLTKVGEQTISYDKQGNPTSYLGHNLTWEKGRQLKSFDGNTYTYNANGIRTSKTVGTVKHTYTLDGTKIMREDWSGKSIIPLYDNEDSVCGIIYNNEPYYNNEPFYFIKNLQGDIIAITDKDANTVAKYSYDAWGKVTSITGTNTTIANVNPFRYRGYYYDAEIGMYYLQSRYYDLNNCRFINADDEETIVLNEFAIGTNLFAYCNNNSLRTKDESGMFSFDDLYNKITGFLQNLFNKFIDNLKNQVQITRNYIKISTTVIKLILDIAVTVVVSKFVKWGIEKIIGWVMKKYIQKSTNSFIHLIGKILNFGATKWLIKTLILHTVNLGYGKSLSNATKDIAVDTILSVSTVLSRINSICSACSSISGFIAFILDLLDCRWDDYLTITF